MRAFAAAIPIAALAGAALADAPGAADIIQRTRQAYRRPALTPTLR